jgi:hypothetical protein
MNNNDFNMLLANKDTNKLTEYRTKLGQTLIHVICKSGDDKCMMAVLERLRKELNEPLLKKILNLRDNNGNTAMHVAVDNDNNILASMLELYGADPSIPNNKHESITETSDSAIDINSDAFVSIKDTKSVHCGNEAEIKKLFNNITKATDSDTPTICNKMKTFSNVATDDIVLSNKSGMKGGGGGITDAYIESFQSRIVECNDMMGGAKIVAKKPAKKAATKKAPAKATTKKAPAKAVTKKATTKKAPAKKVIDTDIMSDTSTDSKPQSTSEIHTQVVQMIRDLGYDESESNIIKAGLYNYTKELHPELGGKDRALKMKSYTKKKYIGMIDVQAIKHAIQVHKANKPARVPKDKTMYSSDVGTDLDMDIKSDTSIMSDTNSIIGSDTSIFN